MSSVDFYFDLSCPYSFMVSTKINQICSKYNINANWHPFLNSALSIKPYTSAKCKKKYNDKLLLFYAQRFVPMNPKFYRRLKSSPPTLDAMIFLTSIDGQHQEERNQTIMKYAQKLFESIWIEPKQRDNNLIQSTQLLKDNEDAYKAMYERLQQNTQNAAKQLNLFATPSIVVNKEHLYVGIERLKNGMSD